MTNFEKWNLYTTNLFSPSIWCDFGWLYTVSSALQRRVWFNRLDYKPLFANLYIVLIGPASWGKSMVLDESRRLLSFPVDHPKNPTDLLKAQASGSNMILRVPQGPNSCTYEDLVQALAKCTRKVVYTEQGRERIYIHSSMAFILSELSSLFKRHEDKIPKLLLQTYDCEDYRRETIGRGEDFIKSSCMSLLCGCVPSFIGEASKYQIFSDGFVSRTLFVYADKPKFNSCFLPEPTDEQLAVRADLEEHIERLTHLFGKIYLSPKIQQDVELWYSDVQKRALKANEKMQGYYGRLRVHVQKLAAAWHFSESYDLEITQEAFDKAKATCDVIEPFMIRGFNAGGRNELAGLTGQVLRYIQLNGEVTTTAEILAEFGSDATLAEVKEMTDHLVATGKIDSVTEYSFKAK